MEFVEVNRKNVEILYALNKELAHCEAQAALFSADKRKYIEAFCSDNPMVYAFLIYKRKQMVGFCIYYEKFATYLASKTLFIEDIYLRKNYTSDDDVLKLFSHIKRIFEDRDCKRL